MARTLNWIRQLNGRRSGETYRWLHRVRGGRLESAVVDVAGNAHLANTIEVATEWISQHGGGYLELESHSIVVPDRGPEGQLSLLRHFNRVGWFGYEWLERHPLA